MSGATADALVLFGASGNLAHKKIFPALQRLIARDELSARVIGVSRGAGDAPGMRERIRDSLETHGGVDEAAFEKLLNAYHHVTGDYRDPSTFDRLSEALGDAQRPLFYLAIPPGAFPVVVEGLGRLPNAAAGRVVVEKPFGRDLASSRALNRTLHNVFDEPAIFRIDHYMGKEAVQNLMYFRFANSFLEPIWNRNYVQSMQVTMAESFGVEGRGGFYDEVGAIRDVVQNHMLQVVANIAMEPPIGAGSEPLRDERVKIFRGIRPLAASDVVRGQYRGYRGEDDVPPDSQVETYAAIRVHLDSWRWQGVPIFIRAGKALPVTATEVIVALRRPPQDVFGEAVPARSNYLRFRLGPDHVAIALGARVKKPGLDMAGAQTELYVCDVRQSATDAYERLIGDAMQGRNALFARQDGVEAAWRIVDPILGAKLPVHLYEEGSWGPAQADALVAAFGGWHDPR